MKAIVTTTINPPTKALRRFAEMDGWTLIVVGDLRTPDTLYKKLPCVYVSPADQKKFDSRLSEAIGWNCIQRRNFGFLWAHDMGAEIIASVDDDNIPLPGWGTNLLLNRTTEVNYFETTAPAFDPVAAAGYPRLWHRGFPLQLLQQRQYSPPVKALFHADIQADFWQGDPDVDAVCRMEHNPFVFFSDEYFPIAANKPSPFNSQNTFFSSRVLPYASMICRVGRMDDIWASYYAQAKGFRVVYGKPSVRQERNPHDLTRDLVAERLGMEWNKQIVEAIPTGDPLQWTPFNRRALELYQEHFN